MSQHIWAMMQNQVNAVETPLLFLSMMQQGIVFPPPYPCIVYWNNHHNNTISVLEDNLETFKFGLEESLLSTKYVLGSWTPVGFSKQNWKGEAKGNSASSCRTAFLSAPTGLRLTKIKAYRSIVIKTSNHPPENGTVGSFLKGANSTCFSCDSVSYWGEGEL